MQWAVEAVWMGQEEANDTLLKAKRSIHTNEEPMPTIIELGSGWSRATEGLRRVFGRVVTLDKAQHPIGRGRKTCPDILASFQRGRDKEGGVVRWAARMSRTTVHELAAVWASPACTEESTCQGFNKGRPWGKGVAVGKKRSKEATQSMQSVLEGIQQARASNPKFQYVLENVAAAARNQMIVKALGEPTIIPGCVYGRKSGKKYAVWMSPEAASLYSKTKINPADPQSRCDACKQRIPHEQAACPQKGDTRSRVREQGQTVVAAANRIPPAMAEHFGMVHDAGMDGNARPRWADQLRKDRGVAHGMPADWGERQERKRKPGTTGHKRNQRRKGVETYDARQADLVDTRNLRPRGTKRQLDCEVVIDANEIAEWYRHRRRKRRQGAEPGRLGRGDVRTEPAGIG